MIVIVVFGLTHNQEKVSANRIVAVKTFLFINMKTLFLIFSLLTVVNSHAQWTGAAGRRSRENETNRQLKRIADGAEFSNPPALSLEEMKAFAEIESAHKRSMWIVNTKTNFGFFNCVASDVEPNSTNFLLLQRGKLIPVAIPLKVGVIGKDIPPFNAYSVVNGLGEFRCYQFHSWRKETNQWDKTP